MDSSVLVKRFDLRFLLIKENVVTDSLFKVYGDSSKNKFKKILQSPDLIHSVFQPGSHAHDSLICSVYHIPRIIRPVGWVSDYGNIFIKNEITELDSMLNDYEKRTSNEIAVVTFDSSYFHDENFDSVVLRIHNFWGVGKVGKNNGILIGISVARREIRINNGYGIVDKLSDEETKEIIDSIVIPAFKKGHYFEGIKDAVEAIMKKI